MSISSKLFLVFWFCFSSIVVTTAAGRVLHDRGDPIYRDSVEKNEHISRQILKFGFLSVFISTFVLVVLCRDKKNLERIEDAKNSASRNSTI